MALFEYSDGDKGMTQLVDFKSEKVLQTTNSVILGYGQSDNTVGLIGSLGPDIFIACYDTKNFRESKYQVFPGTGPIVMQDYPSELLAFPTDNECCFTAVGKGEYAYKIFDLSMETRSFTKIKLPDTTAPALPLRVGDAVLGCASGGKLFRYNGDGLSFITAFTSSNFSPLRLLYIDHYGLVGANFEKRTLQKLSNADATSATESTPIRLDFSPISMTTALGETPPSVYFESTDRNTSATVFSKVNLLTGKAHTLTSSPTKIEEFCANGDGGISAITSDLKSRLVWDQSSGWRVKPVKSKSGWHLRSVKFIKSGNSPI
jgi:hypothetical protein